MKRFHIHTTVKDLDHCIQFYSALFGAKPDVVRDDYAKWMVEDMNINFAITQSEETEGIDHLGIQVTSEADLFDNENRIKETGQPMVESEDVHCCYAQVRQSWSVDPQGIVWESFLTTGESDLYCDGSDQLRRLHAQAEEKTKQAPSAH